MAEQQRSVDRQPTEKWRHLPERVRPEDTVESVPVDRAPRDAAVLSDPESGWMLRNSA
ncbi:hypothetical protein [Actinoplanes sp. TFC3]|uniref:hypothetical protein n=1 Tax=Actinoplanes sp. TFC3 TaxID=1710355 RepID=UPI000A92FD7C|nr:hypothetical protein [Actinoplanes sp. TFC3]